MTRKKTEVVCKYCGGVFSSSGMTAHVRHKHPENYEEFKANRTTIIEEYAVGNETPPVDTPADEPEVEKVTTTKGGNPEPAKKEQPTAGFLGIIRSIIESV